MRRVHTPRTSSSVALQEMRVNLRAEAGRLGTGAPRAAGAQQPPPGTAKSTTVSHLFGFPIYCLFFPAGFFFFLFISACFCCPPRYTQAMPVRFQERVHFKRPLWPLPLDQPPHGVSSPTDCSTPVLMKTIRKGTEGTGRVYSIFVIPPT